MRLEDLFIFVSVFTGARPRFFHTDAIDALKDLRVIKQVLGCLSSLWRMVMPT